MEKNNELEVLRAVGIIYVLIAHLDIFAPWASDWKFALGAHTQFWGGVDLFFAVSGFVIMRGLLPITNVTNTEMFWRQVGAFWVRRFYRLVPASWFWLLASVLLSVFYNKYGTFSKPSGNMLDTISQVFYVSNWHVYYCAKQLSWCGVNSVYWSLSLEEQFYFLLPIAILLLRKNLKWLCIALIAMQFPLYRPIFSALWLTRIDAVLWGVLIAWFSQSKIYELWKPVALKSLWLRVLLTSILLFSLAVLARQEAVPFFTGVMALCSAAMVWLASYNDGLMFRYLRHSKLLLWVGSRSYSIYLAHYLMFMLAMEFCRERSGGALGPQDTLRVLGGGLILTLVASELCYRFIESPFRIKGRKIAMRMVPKSAISVPDPQVVVSGNVARATTSALG